MIVTRTPLRISLFGGGTDYPEWFNRHRGVAIGFAIKQYVYVTARPLSPLHEYKFSLYWREVERARTAHEIKHPVVREVLIDLGIDRPMGFSIIGDLPARNGLGSSSAFTNGFLMALNPLYWHGRQYMLAMQSVHVERTILREAGGYQDQYMTACGGCSRFDFAAGGVQKKTQVANVNWLVDSCFLVHTGVSRPESQVSIEQKENTRSGSCDRGLHGILSVAERGWEVLVNRHHQSDQENLEEIGNLLDFSWEIKRDLSSQITSHHIDAMHDRCRDSGSVGGKLCGAGSGGFLLEIVPPDRQEQFLSKMADVPIIRPGIDHYGATVVYGDSA